MQSLQYDKLLPSDFNVQARLRYVMAKQGLKDIPGWSSWKFVERALAAGEIKVMSEECNDVYLPKGRDTCWPWIDPSFPCNVYEDGIWLAFQKYLLAEGRWAMESSKSRYHAAETLKIEGPQELRQLVMGQLIHVVQLSVTLRGWLKPHPTKWSPVQVTVHEPAPLLHPGALLSPRSLSTARLSSTKLSGYSAEAEKNAWSQPESSSRQTRGEASSVGASALPGPIAAASPTRLSLAAIDSIVSRTGLPSRNLLGRELAEVKPESPPAGSPRLRQGTEHGEEQGAWEQGRERGRAQQWEHRHGVSGMGEQEVLVVPVKPWDEILKVAASPSEGATGEGRSPTWEEERPKGSWRSTPRSAAAAAVADVVESPVSSPSPMSWRHRQKLQEFREFAARVLLSQPHGIQLDQLQRECARKMPRGFNPEALGFVSLRDVLESMKGLARLESFPGGFVLVFASDELKGANLEGCSSPLARAVSASPSAARSTTSSGPVSAALPSPNPRFSSQLPPAAAGSTTAASSGSTPSSALYPSTPTTPRASPPPVPKPRPEGYRRFDTSWGGESSSPFSPRSSPHSSSLRYREPPSSERKPVKESALGPSFSSPLSPFTSLPSPRSLDASPSPRPLQAFKAHQRRPSGLGEEEQFGIKGGNQPWDEGRGWGEGKEWGMGGGSREEVAALGSPSGSKWRTEGRWREVREVRDVREVKEVEEVREELRDEVIKGKQEAPGAVRPEAGPFMQPALFSSSTATSDAAGLSSILKNPSSVSDAGVSTLHSRAVPPPRLELPLATVAAENVTEGSKGNLTESSRSVKASAPAKGRAADGGKARASHKAELMRSDLRQLLQEVLSKPGVHKTGYQLAFLKGAFLQKYAYPLDHTVLGYPRLKALLLSMEDVVHVVAAPGAPDPGSLVHEQPMEVSPIVLEGTEELDEGSPEVAALVLASLERKLEGSAPVAPHADEDDLDARERVRWCSTM
ncbi:unnamed protein product [Closterium sp. NIES-65]|nr:unnamed protein product [Closterium sp. NIES-65]